MKKRTPTWFLITKKIVSLGTTTAISLMALYYPEDSLKLLGAKLIQSAITEMLDSIVAIAYSHEGGADA